MTDQTEPKEPTSRPGSSKEEIALELMRFVATTTGVGRPTGGAGFGGKSSKGPEELVDVMLDLYARCRKAVSD